MALKNMVVSQDWELGYKQGYADGYSAGFRERVVQVPSQVPFGGIPAVLTKEGKRQFPKYIGKKAWIIPWMRKGASNAIKIQIEGQRTVSRYDKSFWRSSMSRSSENMSDKYILIDKKPVPEPDFRKWRRWFENADRRVARTDVGNKTVSTVFLGLDHNFYGKGEPILFETMIFGPPKMNKILKMKVRPDEGAWRHSTWEEAEKGHWEVVRKLQKAASLS